MLLLDGEKYAHIISWTADGMAFTIHDILAFTELPSYFKPAGKLSSFLRKVSLHSKVMHFESIQCILSHLYVLRMIALPLGIFKKDKRKCEEPLFNLLE